MKAFFVTFLITLLVFCSSKTEPQEVRPIEVLKQYMTAFKKKDTTTMKNLLSSESLKMAKQEADSQNITVDDVLMRETFFDRDQTKVEFKNEVIQDGQASVEIKDRFGVWQKVYFVKEEGRWKIAKEKGSYRILENVERKIKSLEEEMKRKFPLSNLNQ